MNTLLAAQPRLLKQLGPTDVQTQKVREQGAARFAELIFPTKKDEAWHYTSLKRLTETTWNFAAASPGDEADSNVVSWVRPEFFNLVFINGQLNQALSDLSALSAAAKVSLEAPQFQAKTSLEALNLAYAHQSVSIAIAHQTSLAKPIQILSFMKQEGSMSHPAITIKLGQGSKATVVETFAGSQQKYFQNSVSKIQIEENANLGYVRLQADGNEAFNLGQTSIQIGRNAKLHSLSMALGAGLARHELNVDLIGEGALAIVDGVSLGSGDQHLDHLTSINHVVGGGMSTQLYKSVLTGKARSVFTGKVLIQKGAAKASSEQLNNNLLLSREAEADSRPQLEILADDVKATHGSTVGQLDEEEIFYFLSRAISKAEAIEILSLGFVRELLFKLETECVRSFLDSALTSCYRRSFQQ